jgi:GntR family transcriptional repressor for pyruvate dehydrogenase complex
MEFTSINTTRSYEEVVRQIEHALSEGRFVRGQKLPTERQLASTFGVSRGVVREAIKVLGTMGLVETRQGSGVYVRNDPVPAVSRALTLSVAPDEESVYRLFEFREPLETLAARYAAKRGSKEQFEEIRREAAATVEAAAAEDYETFGVADERFHTAVSEASGNPYLSVVVSAVRQMQREVAQLLARQSGVMATAAKQHMRIAEAITSGNSERASATMQEHVRYSASSLQAIAAARVTGVGNTKIG